MREKTNSAMDLVGLLKRDGAEPVLVEAMRIGRDTDPLDPVLLAEALREARRNASRCYARDAWAVYMTDPGKMTDSATLIEQQAADLRRQHDEITRLQAMCAQSDGRVELLADELARLKRELDDLRRAQALGVAATPELIGAALDELACRCGPDGCADSSCPGRTAADDVGDLP